MAHCNDARDIMKELHVWNWCHCVWWHSGQLYLGIAIVSKLLIVETKDRKCFGSHFCTGTLQWCKRHERTACGNWFHCVWWHPGQLYLGIAVVSNLLIVETKDRKCIWIHICTTSQWAHFSGYAIMRETSCNNWNHPCVKLLQGVWGDSRQPYSGISRNTTPGLKIVYTH